MAILSADSDGEIVLLSAEDAKKRKVRSLAEILDDEAGEDKSNPITALSAPVQFRFNPNKILRIE